ncbi:hypothetical protein [Shimia aestuarii]|jgi:hypothetical protein|uniref:hypothetical protein n=1 Tax=Shimia aestuarii TaxID=254406 RepID=UPI001FB2562A|nr:hypothetical protein [Shimia aestuarii]MDP7151898.1 hypothetical protein [Paracoccaceae bacterium]
MRKSIEDDLKAIGAGLDVGVLPTVFNRGVIRPETSTVALKSSGQEKAYAGQQSTRSTTRPWERTAGGQGTPGQSGASDSGAPFVQPGLRFRYAEGVGECRDAYPGLLSFPQEKQMWLFAESDLIEGFGRRAAFAVQLPYTTKKPVRAWGFWTTAVSKSWIGPRHTNFPDGSICAFEPRDRTWVPGQSLITLLDLYSLWAVRHLYLEKYGKWPGRQSVPIAAERLLELCDDEFCGCEYPLGTYARCCKPSDQENTTGSDLLNFAMNTRRPPVEVIRFVWNPTSPPNRRGQTIRQT